MKAEEEKKLKKSSTFEIVDQKVRHLSFPSISKTGCPPPQIGKASTTQLKRKRTNLRGATTVFKRPLASLEQNTLSWRLFRRRSSLELRTRRNCHPPLSIPEKTQERTKRTTRTSLNVMRLCNVITDPSYKGTRPQLR